tara:strand:+ start:2809 stop:4623 length:1815 start_codon:yes stop_codon:yes gene_type:complete
MSQWIAAITRGHNGGVCLLKDGKIVFSIEEERLSRAKYDGGPYASMVKILNYTDKIDYLIVAHTQPLNQTAGRVDFTGDDVYTGIARKLGLISQDPNIDILNHPQVVDLSHIHHKLHAACAFYRSGFSSATAVIVDGAGTFIPAQIEVNEDTMLFELESIFTCEYPNNIKTIWKHLGGNGPFRSSTTQMPSDSYDEEGTHEVFLDAGAGIVKAYEAVTGYCGFQAIEAGKTMGLSPYGKPNKNIPKLYIEDEGTFTVANPHMFIPTYPNSALVNANFYDYLSSPAEDYEPHNIKKLVDKENRRDLAYAVQKESQEQVLKLILNAVERTGNKNVVVSGGYGLNCVANYYYLDTLKDMDINLYVEPISSDAGTAIGAAYIAYHNLTQSSQVMPFGDSLYLGLDYYYDNKEIGHLADDYNATLEKVEMEDVVKLMCDKNIVAMFQGRSEAGPRALGNRSLMYDPTDPNGKDHVNKVKRREYFRPFAGTILAEHAEEWFDMRGMKESPHMMYAMNCQPGMGEKIPSIIHVDGTCRIQTVTKQQNPLYYDYINEFYKQTGVPIIFNTSFNLGGEPLVETLDDAFRTLANSDIEYLYLAESGILAKIGNI